MAGWVTDYKSDFGKVYRSVRLNSRLINGDGTRSRTTQDFDLPFLPSVFLAAVTSSAICKSCCSLIIKPRAVKLWLDEEKYLYLEHPFRPTTPDYLAFISALDSNSQILFIERIGERLDDFYTDLLTKP
ncbi:MAG: hypothetical protein AAF652_08575 [Cyanobacteria bacterium P01_C01_bin.72]